MTGDRRLSFSLRRKSSRARPGRIKGRMQNIIVVKEPDRMFSQAVFFLRDDYFLNSDTSPRELLRQAEEAAENYVQEKSEVSRPGRFLIFLLPLLPLICVLAFIIIK